MAVAQDETSQATLVPIGVTTFDVCLAISGPDIALTREVLTAGISDGTFVIESLVDGCGTSAAASIPPQASEAPLPVTETLEPAAESIAILYEIQEGEALLKVAETFGTTRRSIRKDNPGLEEVRPGDLAGTIIIVRVPAGMSMDEFESLPGYLGPVS